MGEPSESKVNTCDDISRMQPVFSDSQLSFVGHDASEIPIRLMQEYADQTAHLDLSFNRLRRLTGLEIFTKLKTLVLDNNEIEDDTVFPHIQSLNTLFLNKNRITRLEQFLKQIQDRFPNLTYLSLLGNTACPNELSSTDKDDEDYQRYRYYVLHHLPTLKFLDSSAVRKEELREAKCRGQYLQVVRPEEVTEERDFGDPNFNLYTPLPQEGASVEQHIGTFGHSKYVYFGRHSEGNRFIRNKDL